MVRAAALREMPPDHIRPVHLVLGATAAVVAAVVVVTADSAGRYEKFASVVEAAAAHSEVGTADIVAAVVVELADGTFQD